MERIIALFKEGNTNIVTCVTSKMAEDIYNILKEEDFFLGVDFLQKWRYFFITGRTM